MIGLGVAGALIAVFGMVVGWIFVGQLADASDDSLDVTIQTLDAVDDTIDLADEVLVATSDGVAALASTLTAVSASFDSATGAIDDIAGLAETIGPSLGDATGTVRTLEKIGDDIDTLLVALSSLPVGPDYNPQAGLGETLGTLADTLEELPEQLGNTAVSLSEFTGNAGELQQQLDGLATSVQTISDNLADTGSIVDQYRASVADARALAARDEQRPRHRCGPDAHPAGARRHHPAARPDRAAVARSVVARRRRPLGGRRRHCPARHCGDVIPWTTHLARRRDGRVRNERLSP